ncbi:MAG: hypothetical protein OXE46_00475 [Chloroflexi bacterium]|nr:hypothetical protein [Chloroflexota bacterium]
METLLMFIADYAALEPNTGKLNVLGAFNRVTVNTLPHVHDRFVFVVKIAGEVLQDRREHKLAMSILDEDSNILLTLEGPFMFPSMPPGIPPEYLRMVELNRFEFPDEGDYRCEVNVDDGALRESIVLRIERKGT